QKGGIGLRGPGETQLETDRRLIRERMRWIQARLERVTRQREQGRRGRKRASLPTVAIVGYTNAGKSTLFNRLTQADVYAADQLFATLDPTLRKIHWSETGPFILADTVGFIRHLPHDLVAAFRATLEETREAQLLLHVIDASDPRRDENIEQVEQVLDEIGAETVPRIRIYNKIDRLASIEAKWRDAEPPEEPSVWLSAKTGKGLSLLKEAIVRGLGDTIVDLKLKLPPEAARIRARLYQQQMIISETVADDGSSLLHVRSSKVAWERLRQKEEVDFNAFMA
ncbi:MAG: GTPase HflX, partial [Gammaproteobacteria bacterium]